MVRMVLMLVGSVNQREVKSWPAHEADLLHAWCCTSDALHLSVLHSVSVGQMYGAECWALQSDALCSDVSTPTACMSQAQH